MVSLDRRHRAPHIVAVVIVHLHPHHGRVWVLNETQKAVDWLGKCRTYSDCYQQAGKGKLCLTNLRTINTGKKVLFAIC